MKHYSYTIDYNRQSDIWNWYQACNNEGYGVDWGERVDAEVAHKLRVLNYEEAAEYLNHYLNELFIEKKDVINAGRAFVEKRFKDDFENACTKLEQITGKELYRTDFMVHLTSFPRAPYNYEKGEFWLPFEWTNPIANFMHETLHFQTIHYWREGSESLASRLDEEDFGTLKEALTVVLDESCVPPMEKPDQGYDIHKDIRDLLNAKWNSGSSFGELVEYGAELCRKN